MLYTRLTGLQLRRWKRGSTLFLRKGLKRYRNFPSVNLRKLLLDESEQELSDGVDAFSTQAPISFERDAHLERACAVGAFGPTNQVTILLGSKGLVVYPHGHAEVGNDLHQIVGIERHGSVTVRLRC